MRADRLFCTVELAARIERAEADLVTQGAAAARLRGVDGFAIPIAGGIATFAEDGSPLNKVAGLGFAGAPAVEALDEVERAFADRASPVQVELATLGDPAVGRILTERGYRLVSFENVLGMALGPDTAPAGPAEIEVRPSPDHELGAWIDLVVDAFARPDQVGVPSHESFEREVIARAVRDLAGGAGVVRYAALRDGVLAGGGSLRRSSGIAQLAGAATDPAHRRHGVQTALLAARIADAAAAGCDVVVVTTQPGSKSQQNAQRRGFDLLYTRAILVL